MKKVFLFYKKYYNNIFIFLKLMKSNIIKKEENKIEKNKKEILNELLKKLIGQRITKLEKNNSIEAKNIRDLTNTSENLVLTLESLSNNARKQIYKNRQKLLNNTNKLPKKMKFPFQKQGIKNQTQKATPKYKRAGSKSFNKDKAAQTVRNTEYFKSGYNKIYSKNIKNMNININENTRRTISPFITRKEKEDLSKNLYNKHFNKNRKTPIKKKKEEDKTSKTNSNNLNNKEKPKIKKQPETNTKQKNNNNINIINKNEKAGNNEHNEKNEEANNTHFLNKLSNELMTKATIKLEDTLVKDSLLVTNTEAGEKEINIDDLISGPVYEEIIIDKSIFNTNNNENNNTKDENKTKKDLKNSSIALYNKLKRSKITFLEGEHDFDLIFKDEKIEDFDIASNLNKNNETNLTEISEHITLEEKFETNLDFIMGYLEDKDIYNLMLVNKECLKTVINALISKTEISIDILQEEINKLKENNPEISFDNIKKKEFQLGDNSLRAINLLNSSSGNNILKLNSNEIKNSEIILIYSLYFIATGKKSKIFILNNDNDKINFMQNYFKNNITKNNFGKFIENELKGKIFDDKEIYHLYKISKKYLDIISPNYFQKINKDIAIFVFVIKDILEQLGILEINEIKPEKEFILLNAKLQSKKAILDELNQIEENI